jgi:hypothetical protein
MVDLLLAATTCSDGILPSILPRLVLKAREPTLSPSPQLLRNPSFHRGVQGIHKQIHRLKHGKPPEELGGTELDGRNLMSRNTLLFVDTFQRWNIMDPDAFYNCFGTSSRMGLRRVQRTRSSLYWLPEFLWLSMRHLVEAAIHSKAYTGGYETFCFPKSGTIFISFRVSLHTILLHKPPDQIGSASGSIEA